ncbi:MAG TPA: hypothetical protein VHG70_11700 [Nocardioidaceae bacterium]|nr:hypothetical protein [Nocardioidaceae bacterium]
MDDPYSSEVPPLAAPEDSPPVRTETALLVRWRQLMGPWGFERRSLWLLWFDEDGFQLPIVVPIDDIPDLPDDDMVGRLLQIAHEVAHVDGSDTGGATVAVTLSRPGSARVTPSDRAWARALLGQAAGAGVSLWPVHLATKGTVRPLTLDDVGWERPRSA